MEADLRLPPRANPLDYSLSSSLELGHGLVIYRVTAGVEDAEDGELDYVVISRDHPSPLKTTKRMHPAVHPCSPDVSFHSLPRGYCRRQRWLVDPLSDDVVEDPASRASDADRYHFRSNVSPPRFDEQLLHVVFFSDLRLYHGKYLSKSRFQCPPLPQSS